jgi:neutral amino acid transport system permease protein
MNWGEILTNSLRAAFNAEAAYFALLAIGLNMHFGYTGLLNFGQVAFMAMGSYGIGVGVTFLGLPFWTSVLVAILAAVLLALLLGLPTLRLRADYLAIVTIAAGEIIRLTFRSVSLREVTGGSSGLQAFADDFYALNPFPPGTYGIGPLSYQEGRFWVLVVGWGLVALAALLLFVLMRSPWGRVVKSVREDEDAARALGKDIFSDKMQSLVLGGIIGAVGGIVFSTATQSVVPDNYSTQVTFFAWTILILGGIARTAGPIVGAILFWFLLAFVDNVLRSGIESGVIPAGVLEANQIGIVRFILVGLGLMLLMIYRPQGLLGDRKELALDAR